MALDATAAMRELARHEQISNVVLILGDAAALPCLDGSFKIAIRRFAAHHFERPEAVVGRARPRTQPGATSR